VGESNGQMTPKYVFDIKYIFAPWTMHFQIKTKERLTKFIFKVNHIFRISILLLHFSALQERHLQEAQRILIKLCVCYVISAEKVKLGSGSPSVCCQPKEPKHVRARLIF
jgi:hypothetical protein